MMAMNLLDEPESIDRFQRILRASRGCCLRQAGVKEGDMVRIGAGELEWTVRRLGIMAAALTAAHRSSCGCPRWPATN